MVDDVPAGFAMFTRGKYAPKDVDYYMAEFFVIRPLRKKGIAEEAVKQVFYKNPGKWKLFTGASNNVTGQRFWKRTIGALTGNSYDVEVGDTVLGEKMIFAFEIDRNEKKRA